MVYGGPISVKIDYDGRFALYALGKHLTSLEIFVLETGDYAHTSLVLGGRVRQSLNHYLKYLLGMQ